MRSRCKRPEGGARCGHHRRRQWQLGAWEMRTAASLTPFIGVRALRKGSRLSTVWALRGGGEARRPIAVHGRRGARTTTSRLGGRRGVRERVAHGERVRMAVRHGRPRRTDQRIEVGLGVRAQQGRGAAGARRRRDGALWTPKAENQLD
jgi:hypothetical protein